MPDEKSSLFSLIILFLFGLSTGVLLPPPAALLIILKNICAAQAMSACCPADQHNKNLGQHRGCRPAALLIIMIKYLCSPGVVGLLPFICNPFNPIQSDSIQ
jgi:hypothetical protein